MELHTDFSLKSFNSFKIDVKTRYYASPDSIEEIQQILLEHRLKVDRTIVLGGGSNILFTRDFDGMVIHPKLYGKNVVEKIDNQVIVKANAGENWDDFVKWTVENNYGGLENLSLIPGTVGACPVQNIGAYGVEVGDLIEKVEAIEMSSGKICEFSNGKCSFGYRNSIFKAELKDKYLITSVSFRLSTQAEFITHYGQIINEINKLGEINLGNIRQAIINIRQSKLPDPEVIPNAGSFFKNPLISVKHAELLSVKFPSLISYPAGNAEVKIAAGWLIDYLGWKGKIMNGAAVHKNQALVLVNLGNANGKQILELARLIKESVYKTFGIELEYEVNIV